LYNIVCVFTLAHFQS